MNPKKETPLPHTDEADEVSLAGAVAFEEVRVEPSPEPSEEEIQRRAYEIHLERGATHGQDLEDWLQAEIELKAKHSGKA